MYEETGVKKKHFSNENNKTVKSKKKVKNKIQT